MIYFVFHSLIRTFDLQSKVLAFESKKEKNCFFFLYFPHLFVPLQRQLVHPNR